MKRFIITFKNCTKYEVIKAQEMTTCGEHIYFYSDDVGIVTFHSRDAIKDVITIETEDEALPAAIGEYLSFLLAIR
jgi:hypothetical protein